MNTNNKFIILFDGQCNLCIGSIQFIINKDSKDKFRFASIQNQVGKEIIKKHKINTQKNDSIILIKNNIVYYRSTAVLFILYDLKTIWKFLVLFYLIPYPLRDLIYILVAKFRYSIFGKKKKCMVPDKKNKSKFLNVK